MQPTEKYYEHDAYRREAVGHILAAEPDSRTGGGRIALDGTVFYPEGGGQPADRGTLTLADGTVLTVTDVHEQAGVIWHMVTSLPAGAVPGAEAAQAIDWAWRFDKMQQHTGEHILSGILHSMFGAENVGFHIGSDAVRMDTNIPISAEGLKAAETAANRIIWENVPVNITYPTREELAALTYRSKKEIEGQVRIVTIPGADVCACCGTHTAFTGAVGQIKILAAENYKGGVRLSIVCGGRALEAAQAMRARQAEIGALLSAKASETANAVHRVYDEYTALKFTHFGLCSQLFDALAAQVTPGADAIRIVPGLDPDGLHRLASRLSEATTGLCAALTPNEKGTGYCIAQAGGDVRALTKALNAALNGRGGGKPGICQGSCAAEPEQVEEFSPLAQAPPPRTEGACLAEGGKEYHKNAQYHSKTGPPNSIAITMPAHRNGPKAKWSFFPAFLAASRYMPYIPPKTMPKNIASSVFCQPRNSPAAAISLMSPPPNAPSMTRQSRNIGTLTQSAPMTCGSQSAGESSTLTAPQTASARFSRSGMVCVSASMSETLSKIPQTASASSAAQLMPNSPPGKA